MAFTVANLSFVNKGIFRYKTTDTIATVTAAGYFNDAVNDLNVYDIILVAGGANGTTPYICCVMTNTGTTVTTSPGFMGT